MEIKDHYTFLLLKPSTRKRVGVFGNHNIIDEILAYVKKFKFQILSQKEIDLSKSDILRLYKDDIDAVKKENPENANKIFRAYVNTLQKSYCLLVLLYHQDKNAKDYLSEIKGHHFNLSKCKHKTIRYIYRNKAWDNFHVEPGEIAEIVPDDNVVHAPRNDSEFLPIISKYMKDEWDKISNWH